MPRYHFNIYDGITSIDREGTELPDIQAARREAIIFAGAVIEDTGKRLKLGEEWRMEVTDDDGLILFRLDFIVSEAPAVKDRLRSQC